MDLCFEALKSLGIRAQGCIDTKNKHQLTVLMSKITSLRLPASWSRIWEGKYTLDFISAMVLTTLNAIDVMNFKVYWILCVYFANIVKWIA